MALITGASAGIGAALAERLVQYGMKVVGCSRNIEAIEVSNYINAIFPLDLLTTYNNNNNNNNNNNSLNLY